VKRRRIVALVSASVLVFIAVLVLATGYVVTRTRYGQEQIRRIIQQSVASKIHGKLYVGAISGGFLSGITIDSIAIRDEQDSLFLSTGRVEATYDPRDLIDKRVLLHTLDVQHPIVHLRQYENGDWNHQRIFKSNGPSGPKAPGRSIGDYVVAESASVHNGTFTLTLAWHPDDTLHGARLDSAVRYNVAHKEVTAYREKNKTLYYHDYHWKNITAFLPRVRLTDPDSNKFGRFFDIGSMSVAEHDPPFDFHNIRGSLRNLGDSIWVEIAHFDLPGSHGSGQGKITWGSNLPVRYDIRVHGDSVSLADVNWVYPTLPTTGGGSTELHIANDPKNLRVIEYQLTKMDVRSTKSHLTGAMTFAVGHPVLVVKDVNLVADPVDFDFLRTINGKPFSVDFRGPLYGTVRGRGGPLNHFVVDASDITWRDTHVSGATSHLAGKGELDILYPAYTAFHSFDVDAKTIDLRSIEYLFPSFPRLGGTISGTATLDSSWLDVRFSDANVIHQDGPGEPSRLTGKGRVTWAPQFMTYDVDVVAQPLSLTMLARSYPGMPLKGLVSGPIKARGTVADLQVDATLSGDAGKMTYAGMLDIYPPGYAARGKGEFAGLDLSKLVDRPNTTPTLLNGAFTADVGGDSLPNLRGVASVALQRSEFNGVRIFPSRGRVSFLGGRMRLDSLRMESTAATLFANGTLGLARGSEDSITFRVDVDSLGGLRRYLARSNVPEDELTLADSLSGTLTITGTAFGRLDSLDVDGKVMANSLYIRGDTIGGASGRFVIRDALRSPNGTITVNLAALRLLGIDLDSATTSVRLVGKTRSLFHIAARGKGGINGVLSGDLEAVNALQVLRLDTLNVALGQHRWYLASPARVVADSGGTVIDSLMLSNGQGGHVSVRGVVPNTRSVSLAMRVDSLALSDLAALAEVKTDLKGYAFIDAQITGTRLRPEIRLTSIGSGVQVGKISLERVLANANYRDRRFNVGVDVFQKGQNVVQATASLPIDVRLFGADALRGDSLRMSIVSDSADLGLVQAFFPTLQEGTGRLSAHVTVGGTYRHPALGGQLVIANGRLKVSTLGITLQGINGGVTLVPGRDSAVVRLRASSGTSPSDLMMVEGWIANLDDADKRFDLRVGARNFHALDRRTLAKLDVTTTDSLRLRGSMQGATLSGSIRIDRGLLYLPDREQLRKQLVDASDTENRPAGPTETQTIGLVPDASSTLIEHLRLDDVRIDLGEDVRLKSREADVKLGGSLSVQRASDELAGDRGKYRLAPQGTITADRGSYTLDLGPVRRDFAVQSGTILFEGTADINPLIDITALYNVKRPSQADLGVIVHLHGPFYPYPVIDFTSNENYDISQSDLVSYLVTGQPSFQLQGEMKNNLNAAAAVLLPSASSVLSASLLQQVPFLDALTFQGGATENFGAVGKDPYSDILRTARIGGEKQVSNNLFVSLSAGLCPFAPSSTVGNDQLSFLNSLGWKVEYRFDPKLSLQAGLEPSSSARTCQTETLRGLVPTPRQWGISLFRSWRF
jgi:translocation and assembly module TamB